MSSRNRNILIVVGAIIAGIAARLLFPMGQPAISVKAEEIFGIPNFTNSMFVLLLVDIFLIVIAFLATRNMQMVPKGLQNFMEWVLEMMFNFFSSINKKWTPAAFPLLATIFLMVLVSNWTGLLPGFGSIGFCHAGESHASLALNIQDPYAGLVPSPFAAAEGESKYLGCQPGESIVELFRAPTADLNLTLALALIAVFAIEYFGFRALGVGYLGKFFNVKGGAVGFIVGIFEFISEIARIPAFMFRLFGNIFAGEVLLIVMIFLLPLALPIPFYIFEVFVGFIQAFIFSVLTIAFIGLATEHHGDDHSHAEGAHH
ncbi:F0F1 ATP synthase subunit A [Candidatus Chloroploca sp. Khr17]|uniref:F0F1 ATP synthase subunit A n=1 Tax=Candidatus Chloroploca sp. Khr17 TaxID=2496869 RepID=UPI00101BB8DE|nr:F0F1 ATP synthase subunit A [Candidatus Chloroploca sp. Khr17]